jgi:flagellar biosynthesis/type III secretory pathway chaperone
MAQPNTNPHPAAPPQIQSAAEAEELIGHFGGVMASLVSILDEETQLVRDGRISELVRIEPKKTELARRYLIDAAAVRTNGAFLARRLPREFDALRRRHGDFHQLLQMNLTVLATAHAVSEGIIRGVAGHLASKAAPQTYGMTGRTAAPGARAAHPISLSRTI